MSKWTTIAMAGLAFGAGFATSEFTGTETRPINEPQPITEHQTLTEQEPAAPRPDLGFEVVEGKLHVRPRGGSFREPSSHGPVDSWSPIPLPEQGKTRVFLYLPWMDCDGYDCKPCVGCGAPRPPYAWISSGASSSTDIPECRNCEEIGCFRSDDDEKDCRENRVTSIDTVLSSP